MRGLAEAHRFVTMLFIIILQFPRQQKNEKSILSCSGKLEGNGSAHFLQTNFAHNRLFFAGV
jgi:hypothetical protein